MTREGEQLLLGAMWSEKEVADGQVDSVEFFDGQKCLKRNRVESYP